MQDADLAERNGNGVDASVAQDAQNGLVLTRLPLADIFTRPMLRLLRNRLPVTCHLPWRRPSDFLCLSWREWRGCPLLRASNEHIPIVRVLRARRAPGRSLSSF